MVAEQMFGTGRNWPRDLAVAGACGLFLGTIGPFGSYLNPSRLTVIAYWTGAVLLGEAMIGSVIRPAALLAPRWRIHPAAAASMAILVMAVPLSLICHAVAMQFWPGAIGHIGPLAWYGQTLVVAAGMAVAQNLVTARQIAPSSPRGGVVQPGRDFLRRLPASLGRDLIALQMEDHYVRAHTALGSALILIPLRRAIEEVAHIPGLKIHRSWWVARQAVVGTAQDGRNLRLKLTNGLLAPVSRANVAAARDARLFVAEREKI